ncbi:MAG: hypothetical protein QIT36_gp062 [Methanophagales virus GBV301]|uniref:Uncharacterized protein n=1 Tax=Methanophagales virus GBV301 TaxID=2999280 RepID=A0A9E8VDC2_9CAUD|nr:MAG: hypothetical protein QIT36_gp062 [Methanophagales virus GBV301]WAE39486.1 MAG: hypothetical protein LDLAKGPJ_00062 [Methanophagales virus GBV301]
MNLEVELVKDGVRIDSQEYHIGDVLVAQDGSGQIKYKGTLKFGAYLHWGYHVGFTVDNNEDPYTSYSLMELLETGWKIVKE